MFGRKEIGEIFTPRNSQVNSDMYIERQGLEKELYRSVNGSMHSFLFGESGNGKSWLYKKVLKDNNINYVVANCASASIKKSITDEIRSVCIDMGSSKKTGYKETKKAGFSAGATGEFSHEGEYVIHQQDSLLESFKSFNKQSSGHKSVIVFDNVETIFKNENLMGELSDIIILLDDERYAKYKIKFLIVGVPNEVIRYFSSAKNPSSVGNRIDEIERVASLEYLQVLDLVNRGFNDYLKVNIPDIQTKRLSRHVYDITLGVPQRIHEYCECMAYSIEDNKWVYSHDLMDVADFKWLKKGLRECYSVIEACLNSEETTDGRRNQVIYALGRHAVHQVDTTKIGETIVEEFPNTAPDSNSGIGQVLAYLSKGQNPIVRKIPNSNSYSVTDPRYLMCIRIILYKDMETETVRKKVFKIV